MELIEKIIFMVIPAIAVALIAYFLFLAPGAGFNKASEVVDESRGLIPNESIYGEIGSKVDIARINRLQVMTLSDTISRMIKSNKQNCFANYGGFSQLGEGGASMIMTYDSGTDETKFRVMGGEGGGQIVTDILFGIEGMKPCVIAGTEGVTQNFWDRFISGANPSAQGYYHEASSIKIWYFTGASVTSGLGSCDNGNQIVVEGVPSGAVNDQCNNFEDGGMLFTPDGKHICFFPTIYGDAPGVDYDEDGIDNDWIKGEEETSLKRKYSRNELEKCY